MTMLLSCVSLSAEKKPTNCGMTEIPIFPKDKLLVGIGYTNQYDTYISPLEYRGPQLDILWDNERRLKGIKNGDCALSFQSLLDIQMHTSTPESSTLRMYGGDIHYDAGWYYNWLSVAPGLRLKAGGQVGGTLGGIYCNRSGNNPANAHAAVRLSASVGAQYKWLLRHTDVTFYYQADLPVLGAAFSPDYEQSYYELSKYGYCHNICATTPANAFSIRQMLSADINFKHGTLTVGYKADIRQAKLNHLRQHQYAHSFMIGWRKGF